MYSHHIEPKQATIGITDARWVVRNREDDAAVALDWVTMHNKCGSIIEITPSELKDTNL